MVNVSVALPADTQAILAGLGQAIRELRSSRRLSQEELGNQAGLHRNYVGGIERGERSPTVAAVIELALVLQVPVSEIFARAEQVADY